MSAHDTAALARGWIEAWIRMDMDWLCRMLAEDFVHVSPFGRLEGRDPYLTTVEPLARKSVAELVVEDVVTEGDRAVVRFVNRTPNGDVPSCDWVHVVDGRIQEIHSYYDTARLRAVLSPEEQEGLSGPADGG